MIGWPGIGFGLTWVGVALMLPGGIIVRGGGGLLLAAVVTGIAFTIAPPPGAASFSQETITLSKFAAVHDGMSYSDAVGVIGSGGTEISRAGIGGTTTVMYSWKNRDGSNMNAMFQNDRLVTKAQFGLR